MTRFILLGGFLGAGKTTALLRLARTYAEAGRRVGIITNDQAEDLVDTGTFRAAGFDTEEVPRGCFCCRFDEMIEAAGRFEAPDVLLAEPVGSCTDIVATVIRPLENAFAERFTVAPYVALLDPHRAREALGGRGGFGAKVTYLFKMQQHEADAVVVNKADLLPAAERAEVEELARRNFAAAEVFSISARTGEGFDRLVRLLDRAAGDRRDVDVDYDLYGEGEARLGWLNATFSWRAAQPEDADALVMDLIAALRDRLVAAGVEPAHVKLRLGDAVANLTGREPELSQQSAARVADATLTLNARVECTPEQLRAAVEDAWRDRAVRTLKLESFAPTPPSPPTRP